MRVAFLHNEFAEDPAYDPAVEVPPGMPVAEALERRGHDVVRIACTLDLSALQRELEDAAPDVVFNHVESLGGSDLLASAAALLLEAIDLPYTGCPAEALVATTSKLTTKRRLVAAGLPTPPWYEGRRRGAQGTRWPDEDAPIRHIIKAVNEHASFKLTDDSVLASGDEDTLMEAIGEREATYGKRHFAERFVPGREFNLSLLGVAEGGRAEVLPPAEIRFLGFPSDKPRIVGHGAKWAENSFEYRATPRSFDHAAEDAPLLRTLAALALETWHLFGLGGYARVDVRVDERGAPWILEVNANPCLAPDAGFAAALVRAGLEYDETMDRLLDSALAGASAASTARQ